MEWTPLLLLVGLLWVQVLVALRAEPVHRVILLGQAVFALLGYALRGLLLMALEPTPRYGDALADPRTGVGGYDESVPHLLYIVVLGQACFLLVSALLVARRRRASQSSRSAAVARTSFAVSPVPVVVLYLLSWIGRAGWLLGTRVSWTETLALAGSGAALVLAVMASRREAGTDRRTMIALLLITLIALELLWSYVVASKTPLLAAGLGLVIGRCMSRGRFPWGAGLVAGALVVLAFTAIQGQKDDAGTQDDLVRAEQAYPPAVQPLLPVVKRFDLLVAVTDADLSGSLARLSVGEFVGRAARSFVPEPIGGVKQLAGAVWAQQVRPLSNAEAEDDVSLAEGPTAEGLAYGGMAGLVIENALVALLAAAAARLTTFASPVAMFLGASLVASTALFERGLLGLVEDISKGLQLAILFGLIHLMCTVLAGRRPPRLAPATRNTTGRDIVLADHRSAPEPAGW